MKEKVSILALVLIASIALTAYDFDKKSTPGCAVNNAQSSNEQITASLDLFNAGIYTTNNTSNKQDYFYSVRRKYNRSITKEELKEVELVDVFFDEYPSTWIDEYRSVELIALKDGEELWAKSPTNVLSKKQKEILQSMDVDDEYTVLIKFKSKNVVTNKLEDRDINISMSVIPEVEAEFIGGYENLINYLEENSINEIAGSGIDVFYLSTIQFTVNEKGAVKNVKLIRTSGSELIDDKLMSTISTMPKWKPAKDADGNMVSQNFLFNSGMDGC